MYGDFGRAQITVGFKVIFHQVNSWIEQSNWIEHSCGRWSTQTNWPGWSFWGADIPHKIFFHLVFHYLTRWGCSRYFGVSLCCYHTYHLALFQGEERLCDCKTSVHGRHDKVGWKPYSNSDLLLKALPLVHGETSEEVVGESQKCSKGGSGRENFGSAKNWCLLISWKVNFSFFQRRLLEIECCNPPCVGDVFHWASLRFLP